MQTITARFFAFFNYLVTKSSLLRKGAVKILPLRFLRTKLKYLALLCAFSIYLTNPTVVAADFLKVTTQADIFLQTPFEISLEISAQPNTTYHVKSRIGAVMSDLRDGQTLDEVNGVWLTDSVAWTSFPKFSTDENGHWVGTIKAQSSKNAKMGANFLVIRIKPTTGDHIDSATYTINISAKQQINPPPPVVQVGEPILNEFVPQPETGGKEWVEIKNKGNTVADLSGWKVDDKDGGSTAQILDSGSIIQPGGFLVVTFQNPKLNDLTDTVRLLKPDDSVVESYTYNETVRGQSWSKEGSGNWFLTASITPNAENSVPAVNTTAQAKLPTQKTVNNQPSIKPTEEAISKTANKLPQVLATSEAKIATVSSSFNNKKTGNPLTIPLVVLGSLLIVGSGGFLIKKKMKSGQPENSDQPL